MIDGLAVSFLMELVVYPIVFYVAKGWQDRALIADGRATLAVAFPRVRADQLGGRGPRPELAAPPVGGVVGDEGYAVENAYSAQFL